ncbi:MAG: helix-turn-helix transcriptional regulator [Synergistaceae bacterium]|nr:helix-turn-helix transcriptional regulator [Synergistaceae bacterium]
MEPSVDIRNCTAPGVDFKDTGFGYTLSLIGGKYKMIIIYSIAQHNNNMRFNELHKFMGNISFTALSSALKELEARDLLKRVEYPQIPPKVEYSLTERGLSLIPLMEALCEWGKKNRPK